MDRDARYFQARGFVHALAVHGGYAFLSESGGIIEAIDVSNPALPVLAGEIQNVSGNALWWDGETLLVAAGLDGLLAFRAAAPALRLAVTAGPLPDGLHLRIEGAAGQAARIQRSENLADWTDWKTITLEDAPSFLIDDTLSDSGHLFYRAVTP
jgi:hypothetical protein